MHTLLVIGAETQTLQRIIPLLQRADFDVQRTPADGALALLAARPFDLIVARVPLAGCTLAQLVEVVRGGVCRNSALLLLADAGAVLDVAPFLGHGVNRIISLDAPAERLLRSVGELIGAAPRGAVRAIVQLELRLHGSAQRRVALTHNLSSSGMLVRGVADLAVGARLAFELSLPGHASPVRGEGVVVRRSNPATEGVEGAGISFEAFEQDGLRRLEGFLATIPAAPVLA